MLQCKESSFFGLLAQNKTGLEETGCHGDQLGPDRVLFWEQRGPFLFRRESKILKY